MMLNKSLRRIKNVVFKQKTTRISFEGWIADWGFSVRLNLGKFSIPTYEPLAFWGNGAKTEAALKGIKYD